MAAIGPKVIRLVVCALLLVCALDADETQDVERRVSYVAKALTAGNPADAMTPFAKDFTGYSKLSDYFTALTNAFQIASEIEFADQNVTGSEATLTAHWALTLSDEQTNYTQNRNDEIKVRLILKDGKWKIIEFSPIALFDPQQKR